MKIREMDKTRLKNDEHFMFHKNIIELLLGANLGALRIAAPFAKCQALFNTLDEGYKKITESPITALIKEEDKKRDGLFSGLVNLVNAKLKSPNELHREAARRVKIPLKAYGNVSSLPLNEQTSAVINLMQELEGPYLEDYRLLGLEEFALPMKASNVTLKNLALDRYAEEAAKTEVVVKKARQALDAAYDDLVERLNAFALLEGGEECENLIKVINRVIAKYTAILNTRRGKGKNGKKPKKAAGDAQSEQETEAETQ